jgi:hypothetical protein
VLHESRAPAIVPWDEDRRQGRASQSNVSTAKTNMAFSQIRDPLSAHMI